jgi:hypothetical protein
MARECGKCTLKKEDMDINRNNCETYFLLYLDKELNNTEQVEVENFLKEHTDLQKEFSLLQLTKMWPGEIVFDQKELLYHKEEKRRVIPMYWTRIAAALVLFLAGTLFMISLLRSNQTDISGKKQSVVSVETKKDHLNPVTTEKSVQSDLNPNTEKIPVQAKINQTHIRETAINGNHNAQTTVTNSAMSSAPGAKQRPTADYVGQPIQSSPDDDLVTLAPKSNTNVELQARFTKSAVVAPGRLLDASKTPALAIALDNNNSGSDVGNGDMADIQTDNSISVIALNDRNKGITSFFKKLTQRRSGNETAENTKKLRVSVFQFSY